MAARFSHTLSRCSFKIDLNVKEGHEGYHRIKTCPPPLGYKLFKEQQHKLSGQSTATTLSQTQKNALAAKQKSHAMSIAMRPGQQILMNAFMMYISGSQLNIFSISITSMAILTPVTNILSMDAAFGQLPKVDLQWPKLVYCLLNLICLALGLYKMSSMRLLPTTSADWVSKIVFKEVLETTSIPPDDMMVA